MLVASPLTGAGATARDEPAECRNDGLEWPALACAAHSPPRSGRLSMGPVLPAEYGPSRRAFDFDLLQIAIRLSSSVRTFNGKALYLLVI